MNHKFTPRILALLAALLLSVFITGFASAQDQPQYPLTGLRFESPEGSTYDAYTEANGRIWQPQLLSVMANQRVSHTVAIKLAAGKHVFNGVVCTLQVDEDRDGATYETTVGRGNGLEFEVSPKDLSEEEKENETIPVAWALVECDGGASSGFDIWAVDFNTIQSADPASTTEADATAQPEDRMSLDEPEAEEVDEVCISGSRDGEFLCDPAGNWVYAPAAPTVPPPPTATPEFTCPAFSSDTGEPLQSQDGLECNYGPAEDGTTETEEAAEDNPVVVPSWWSSHWWQLLFAVAGLVLAFFAGQRAYIHLRHTNPDLFRGGIWTAVAIGGIIVIISMLQLMF